MQVLDGPSGTRQPDALVRRTGVEGPANQPLAGQECYAGGGVPLPVRGVTSNQEYEAALASGLAIAGDAWAPRTTAARDRDWREFTGWVQASRLQSGQGLYAVTPNDIIVYFQSHWFPVHGPNGTWVLDGRPTVVPGTLHNVLGHLSTMFICIGRSQPWGSLADLSGCNPVASRVVQHYRMGYHRRCAASGYMPTAAVPWGRDLLSCLVPIVEARCNTLSVPQRMPIWRDLAALCLVPVLGDRGSDVGKLGLGSFTKAGDPRWSLGDTLSPGDIVHLRFLTKTRQYEPGPGKPVTFQGDSLCPLYRIQRLLVARQLWGCPVQTYIFSPLQRNNRSFKDEPLSGSALQQRFSLYLDECELNVGQSIHGGRRGRVQELDQTVGMGVGMQLMDIRSEATWRRYSDPSRPTRRRS